MNKLSLVHDAPYRNVTVQVREAGSSGANESLRRLPRYKLSVWHFIREFIVCDFMTCSSISMKDVSRSHSEQFGSWRPSQLELERNRSLPLLCSVLSISHSRLSDEWDFGMSYGCLEQSIRARHWNHFNKVCWLCKVNWIIGLFVLVRDS